MPRRSTPTSVDAGDFCRTQHEIERGRHCERGEAIHPLSAATFLDCFAEPVIGRICATRWLAMTTAEK
jgi:hypothetical protein